MRRYGYAAGRLGLFWSLALGAACTTTDPVTVGLLMRAPQGLLDDASEVTLRVIDSGAASCDEATGHVDGSPPDDAVQSFSLERGGCAGGATWCKTITLDKDDSSKIFGVIATGPAGLLAEGCTTARIDQDPLEVSIQVHRAVLPKCCGDGALQPGEQCDSGQPPAVACGADVGEPGCTGMEATAVCGCDCVANEMLLSIDNPGGSPALGNAPGTKRDLALAFSGPAGQVASSLRAVFTDTDAAQSTVPDINIRLLQSNLEPYPSSGALAPLSKQLRLPDCSNVINVLGPPRTQETAALVAVTNDTVGVVYASNEPDPGRADIFMSLQQGDGCANDPPFQVNALTDLPCWLPDIARAGDGSALIVWHASGQVRGRIWSSAGGDTGTLTPVGADVTIATSSTGRPRVAGSAAGWLVAYEAEGNVWLVNVSPSEEVGVPLQVNANSDGVQDQPDVARLSDGRTAVVWHSGGAIFAQRFSAMLEPRAGDQDAPLGVSSPPGYAPTVAGTDEGGGAFVVAWAATDLTVWARYLYGDQGFAYNSVTGQNDDFLASHPAVSGPDVGMRAGPSVAIGGVGWVAIGWQDDSLNHPGVYVRGFPLPE